MKILIMFLAIGMLLFLTMRFNNGKSFGYKYSIRSKERISHWFHFNGNATSSTDLNDPSKYSPESMPVCNHPTAIYRCDILIYQMEDDASLPDLSESIQDERRRSTAID